jgi:ornithine cyclodeaminase/alanine dehydrogenase-like protein (mu-crystallin family)
MRYLSGRDLVDLASPTTLIAALEKGLCDFAANRAIVPVRHHLHFDGNTLLTMPALGEDTFGVKVISVVPSNGYRGMPVTTGLMMLSDRVNGRPLAVLDAAMLTALRTGAVGALGLKCTAPPDVDRIGVIGTGVQGTWQAIFACAARKVRTIDFVARSDEKAKRFVAAVSHYAPWINFSRCVDAAVLLTKAPVVIAATTSADPVLPEDRRQLENKHFISIGSFKPSMTELPHSVYQIAQQVVVDSDAAKFEVGDLIGPLSLGLLREENVIHIADLVVGKRSVDTNRTTVFKSVGMALYDLYAARSFLSEAQRLGRGTLLDAGCHPEQ